jgi:hypothetical protein
MKRKKNNYETRLQGTTEFKHEAIFNHFGDFWCDLFLAQDYANARDLVEAAQSAQTTFNRIGVAAISIGITLGGILFTLGAAQIGRMLLISGGIGAAIVLGAPTLVNMLAKFFGVSV